MMSSALIGLASSSAPRTRPPDSNTATEVASPHTTASHTSLARPHPIAPPPFEVFNSPLASRLISRLSFWPRRDSNPHGDYAPRDFKSLVSAIPPRGLSIDATIV